MTVSEHTNYLNKSIRKDFQGVHCVLDDEDDKNEQSILSLKELID